MVKVILLGIASDKGDIKNFIRNGLLQISY